jgi:DNA polymerase-3 subunit epsilon
VARKTYQLDSYRLPLAAAAAGYAEFSHHDALADALACAQIIVDAAARAGAADVFGLADALGLRVTEPAVPALERAVA